MMTKETICTAVGVVGSAIAAAFGGWDEALVTLIIFMVIDYLSGLAVAGIFHKSNKSENGALESRAGWKGLCRRALVKQPNLRKRGNMRGLVRQKQKVYWSRISEKTQGLDRIKVYEKPVLYSFSVSSTAGTPEEIAAGIVPDYDRYITSFNRNFHPQEADIFWIDRIPQISEDGNLILDENGEPTVLPDYTLKKILDTQKGNIARYGISKRGNENG